MCNGVWLDNVSNAIMKEMIGGCCVCGDDEGYDENPLVYCDGAGCTVAVHQGMLYWLLLTNSSNSDLCLFFLISEACYGIKSVPKGDWFCRPCQAGAKSPTCELCPSPYGALKPTSDGKWVHIICALYIPEVNFGDTDTMEPILLDRLKSSRLHNICMFCEQSSENNSIAKLGASIKCFYPNCNRHFHVTW